MTERTYTADEVDAMIARAIAREREREQPAQQALCKYGNEPTSCTSSPMDCQCALDAVFEQPAQQKPVAWMDAEGDVYRTEPDKNWCPPHYPLYAAPQPAQQPLKDEQRVKLRDAFAQALTSVYVCGRVWDAWNYGTMSENDFQPASECEEVLDSLIEAAHGITKGT